jgi:hypothetical protein
MGAKNGTAEIPEREVRNRAHLRTAFCSRLFSSTREAENSWFYRALCGFVACLLRIRLHCHWGENLPIGFGICHDECGRAFPGRARDRSKDGNSLLQRLDRVSSERFVRINRAVMRDGSVSVHLDGQLC